MPSPGRCSDAALSWPGRRDVAVTRYFAAPVPTMLPDTEPFPGWVFTVPGFPR